eukprot:SAG22_NODE_492_length_9824_cov_12.256864_3_plen_159_part_00
MLPSASWSSVFSQAVPSQSVRAIIVVLSAVKADTELIDKYTKTRDELNQQYSDEQATHQKSVAQEKRTCKATHVAPNLPLFNQMYLSSTIALISSPRLNLLIPERVICSTIAVETDGASIVILFVRVKGHLHPRGLVNLTNDIECAIRHVDSYFLNSL